MHRDLKPANILVTYDGRVKIGDLGLARIFQKPLQPLYNSDKVVVTIWYRSPELLLGTRHYTLAIDLWAVGCIYGELLGLKPIFKGDEVKQTQDKSSVPFQSNQMTKIVDIMGYPDKEDWPLLPCFPDYAQLQTIMSRDSNMQKAKGLDKWWEHVMKTNNYSTSTTVVPNNGPSPNVEGLALLKGLLEYNPDKRLTAEQCLKHDYFQSVEVGNKSIPLHNCFEQDNVKYPTRKISQDDNDIWSTSLPGTKRGGLPDDSALSRNVKRFKEG